MRLGRGPKSKRVLKLHLVHGILTIDLNVVVLRNDPRVLTSIIAADEERAVWLKALRRPRIQLVRQLTRKFEKAYQ